MPHPIPAVLALSAALILPLTVAAPAEAAEVVTVTHTPAAAPAAAPHHSRHWLHCHTRSQPCAVPRPAPRVTNARARVVAAARKWLGTPYRYGGTTRRGVDCAGFTQAVMRAVGVRIPRTAAQQLAVGHRVRIPRPGDLYFYNAGHVVLIVKVSRGRVVLTEAARHSGTVVAYQVPYAAGLVRAFLA